ncbi:MAG: hypothetical protein JWR72_3293 [Flavisolibacter sp.]|nr:hypothetical protein [Flavisolibacter sp.]
MACNSKARHRIKGEDFRRQLFAKQERLLGQLKEEWSFQKQKDHETILMFTPFDGNTNYQIRRLKL